MSKNLEIQELKDKVKTHKRKHDEMMEELTIFKEKEKEDLFRKKEEASRKAMTTAMNAIISQNNVALRQ